MVFPQPYRAHLSLCISYKTETYLFTCSIKGVNKENSSEMFRRKKLLSQAPSTRTRLRLALYVGAASISGLVVLLLIVFNITKREMSKAAYAGIQTINTETFQTSDSVFRGSINIPVIGLLIDVKGGNAPVKLNSISFSLQGSSKPCFKNMENIKIWYTGSEKSFSPANMVYSGIAPAENQQRVDINRTIPQGISYFWITSDIKSDANPGQIIDAEVSSVVINGNSLLTLLAAPPGSKVIRNNKVMYSQSSGSFNDVNIWNSDRQGKGQHADIIPAANTCYFIQKGSEVTISGASEIPFISVEQSGKLTATKEYHMNELTVNSGGLIQANEANAGNAVIKKLTLEDGASYIHASSGEFAPVNANLSPTSNVVFLKYSQATFQNSFTWGNVSFDARDASDAEIGKAFKSVKGNFEIRNTGNGSLYTEGVAIMSIKGNFVMTNGSFEGVRKVNSKLVMNVGGEFMITGGTFKDVENNSTESARTTLNLFGDVTLTGGKILLNNARDDGSFINMMGMENPRVRWTQSDKAQVELCNVSVKPQKEVFLKGNKLGEIAEGRIMTVERNAKLWCATFQVTGQGKFMLSDYATLCIGHVKGISSTSDDGNIITGQRQFSSGANYVYYMNTTPQETGRFSTFPKEGTIRNLTIKKENPSQSVILSSDFFVTDQVKVSMGDLDKGNYKLSLSDMSQKNNLVN